MKTANHISVIVPVLNEHKNLPKLLDQFRHFSFEQVIFVDGGSTDDTWQALQEMIASKPHFHAIQSTPGRAIQMNAGAKIASANNLLFLHADTLLPESADKRIRQALEKRQWGRFDIQFIEPGIQLSMIAWFINWRSRLSSIATGDQALFVRRDVFEKIKGFAEIPLMEDINFSRQLLKLGKPACCKAKVKTSARRWLNHGIWRTVFLMWRLRFAYFMGSDPTVLAEQYRQVR